MDKTERRGTGGSSKRYDMEGDGCGEGANREKGGGTHLIDVAGGDVSATSEPPDSPLRLEVAVVEMHCGRVGVLGVHDRAQAAREKGDALPRGVPLPSVLAAELAPVVGSGEGLLWHGTVDDGKVAASLLPNLATSKHSRDSTSSVLPHPCVLAASFEGRAGEMVHKRLLVAFLVGDDCDYGGVSVDGERGVRCVRPPGTQREPMPVICSR